MNTKLSHDVAVIIFTMTQVGMVPVSHVDIKAADPTILAAVSNPQVFVKLVHF